MVAASSAARALQDPGKGWTCLDPPLIEVRRHFDATAWQVASSGGSSGSTLLVTWSVEPEPVDAGVPPAIRMVLAEALSALGPCWFAGDEDVGIPVATLLVSRGLSWQKTFVFRADRPQDLHAAFESGTHNWSMGAQWLVVGSAHSTSNDGVVGVIRTLLEDWNLPKRWPAEVSAIIQAGVDGDAAGCHCRTQEIEGELRKALELSATAYGVVFRTIE